MKKLVVIMFCMAAMPAFADDYGYGYDTTPRRDNYIGVRLHQNERIAFGVEFDNGDDTKLRDDSMGFGLAIGNRLTDHIKIEFETAYTYGGEEKYGNDYDFDIWSNMLNVYLYQQFGGAVEPYAGLGIGVSGIWGNVSGKMNTSDSTADMSWSAMVGVNFALNQRIDLNLGLKYQNYGDIDMTNGDGTHTTTEIDATEIYIGAAYKFGL